MKEGARCGVCGAEQDNSAIQKILPIVKVSTGMAVYRCHDHLNVPPREGEAEPYRET